MDRVGCLDHCTYRLIRIWIWVSMIDQPPEMNPLHDSQIVRSRLGVRPSRWAEGPHVALVERARGEVDDVLRVGYDEERDMGC